MIILKLEKTAPIHLNVFGLVLIALGLPFFIHLEILLALIGILVITLGLFLATAKNGIIIDTENNQFRNTVFFLGLEFGSWKELSKFTDIAILTKNKGITALSRGQRATTFSNKVFEIYMLTENHRERIILKRYKDEDKATVFAQDIAHQLQMELNVYSPS